MAEQDTNMAQAAAQDDTSGQAQAEGQGTQETEQDKDFNQKVWSAAGRLYEKKMKDERGKIREELLAELKPLFQSIHAPPPPGGQDESLKKFEEQIQEMIFSGKSVEAIDRVLRLKEQAKQNMSQAQNVGLLRGITTFSDQPYYEDIHQNMIKLAREKVSEGAPVDKALKWAYVEAKADFLENKMTSGDGETSGLSLSTGGRRTERTKTIKLTEAEEAACVRDIKDGYYKSKEDWVKARSAKIPRG